jgi:hypothetical protein
VALLGIQLNELVNLFRREGFPVRRGMARLSPRLAAGRRRKRCGRRCARRIRAGRLGGVRRVAAQAVFQRAQSIFNTLPGLPQRGVLGTQPCILQLEFLDSTLKYRYLVTKIHPLLSTQMKAESAQESSSYWESPGKRICLSFGSPYLPTSAFGFSRFERESIKSENFRQGE